MQGDGFYNRHGWMQASGITLALPLLVRAAALVPLAPPLLVADYGASQGRNSLRPMRLAIEALRARAPDAPRAPHAPITVVHTDQPGNDFASLFTLLRESPDSYLRHCPNSFAAATGGSFFAPVLAPGSVALGWSSFAAQWLSSVLPVAAGHVFTANAPPEVRDLLQAQAAADWQAFVAARASELRPGGRLVVLVPGPKEDGGPGVLGLLRAAAMALRRLVANGRLPEATRARAFIATMPRTMAQLLAPLAAGDWAGLAVEDHQSWHDAPDPAWDRYRADGDIGAMADAHTVFFRATFLPTLLNSMEPFDLPAQRELVAEELAAAIRAMVVACPKPYAATTLHAVVLRRA